MNVMISKGTKLSMNLHFPHSNMPAYRKIPVNLVVYPDFLEFCNFYCTGRM